MSKNSPDDAMPRLMSSAYGEGDYSVDQVQVEDDDDEDESTVFNNASALDDQGDIDDMTGASAKGLAREKELAIISRSGGTDPDEVKNKRSMSELEAHEYCPVT